MIPFPTFQKWTTPNGDLTTEAREWIAALLRTLAEQEARIAALEP